MSVRHVFRSAVTGRWVKRLFARRHKRTTVEERYPGRGYERHPEDRGY